MCRAAAARCSARARLTPPSKRTGRKTDAPRRAGGTKGEGRSNPPFLNERKSSSLLHIAFVKDCLSLSVGEPSRLSLSFCRLLWLLRPAPPPPLDERAVARTNQHSHNQGFAARPINAPRPQGAARARAKRTRESAAAAKEEKNEDLLAPCGHTTSRAGASAHAQRQRGISTSADARQPLPCARRAGWRRGGRGGRPPRLKKAVSCVPPSPFDVLARDAALSRAGAPRRTVPFVAL